MTVHVLAEAEQELQDAILHYETIDLDLSRRLKTEAGRVLRWIGETRICRAFVREAIGG